MKKFIILVMLVCLTFICGKNVAFADGDKYVKAIYSTVCIFDGTDINTSNLIAEVQYGTKLKLVQENSVLGQDGFNYYNIYWLDGNGFVLCSQVLSTEWSSPQKELDSNASLKKDTYIYVQKNGEYEKTEIFIKQTQKIRIIDGYDSAKVYTKIQYKDIDGDLTYGYILTEDIQVSPISRIAIGAVIIVVTTISLVLVLFGIKGKKKKKA